MLLKLAESLGDAISPLDDAKVKRITIGIVLQIIIFLSPLPFYAIYDISFYSLQQHKRKTKVGEKRLTTF